MARLKLPNSEGWLKIDRKLASDKKLWLSERFTHGQAWIDLILLAEWRTVGRYSAGSVYKSQRYLADRWGWSQHKVERFLIDLKNAGKIDFFVGDSFHRKNGTENGSENGTLNGTVISLKNWGKYQHHGSRNGTVNGTENGNIIRNNKEGKKESAESTQNADAASLGWKTADPRVPEDYRKDFASFEEYDRWKNR